MLMIHVKVSLQIPVGSFVNGKIIQMHTTHESNYTVMKLPRNGNSKTKKINKKNNSGCRTYQAQLMGWMHLIIFTQIIQS